MVIAFLAGAAEAFDTPARQALYPHLIERSAMTSAVALNSTIWQGTRIVAPAIAGFIIDLINTGTALVASAGGFFIMAGVMLFLRIPPIPQGAPRNPALALWEGMTFIGKNSIFAILIGMTFFNSFFGMAYVLLMPVFAVDVLEVGARGQGILLGVGGVGALLTTIWLGARGGLERRGIAIVGGAIAFGLAIIAFGVTSHFLGYYPLALALMVVLGCSNSIYMISIQSSLQMLVPDNVRGPGDGVLRDDLQHNAVRRIAGGGPGKCFLDWRSLCRSPWWRRGGPVLPGHRGVQRAGPPARWAVSVRLRVRSPLDQV